MDNTPLIPETARELAQFLVQKLAETGDVKHGLRSSGTYMVALDLTLPNSVRFTIDIIRK